MYILFYHNLRGSFIRFCSFLTWYQLERSPISILYPFATAASISSVSFHQHCCSSSIPSVFFFIRKVSDFNSFTSFHLRLLWFLILVLSSSWFWFWYLLSVIFGFDFYSCRFRFSFFLLVKSISLHLRFVLNFSWTLIFLDLKLLHLIFF